MQDRAKQDRVTPEDVATARQDEASARRDTVASARELLFSVAGGGMAKIVQADAEKVVVETGAASPPGSTLRLLILEREVGVKVRACKRVSAQAPVTYRVEGRWLGLSREQRDLLLRVEQI